MCVVALLTTNTHAQRRARELTFPPQLPGGKSVVTDRSTDFLEAPATLRNDVEVAKTPPTIDFALFPGQDYPGKPWSAWGESIVASGKYYASIGDHLAPAGNAFVYEYDQERKTFRKLLDLAALLKLPDGHYAPGKIHTRLDLGSDGWLYCATHRGSTRVTTDEYHYRGDWIVRCDPKTGKAEVVAHAPVPKHCIPNGALDPARLIFYGGTTPGARADDQGGQFFAYDVAAKKLLYAGPNGPSRSMIVAASTGRVYFTPGKQDSPLYRFDPATPETPVPLDKTIGIRAATRESPNGKVYTVSSGQGRHEAMLYAFDTKTETVTELGPAAVGTQTYIASMSADGAGRFVYYVPGAHGGSDRDGSPLVQFDTRTKQKKVVAFLHPFYEQKYGFTPKGTYSIAADPSGERVFITWNVSRGGRAWDCCALAVVHVSQSER
ncbi:MAG: hypothetical protein WD894_06040 [Pirellulales bacterium]